jgi:type I restriction enzyme R subunit
MIDISEKNFEATIEQSLLNNGYQKRDSKEFDKTFCLIPQDVVNFIQTTQPQEWDKFKSHYGEDAETKLFQRLSNQIKTRTTLEILRQGIKVTGCKFKLVYFQPASNLNPETQKLYQSNIFTVIRQLYYSEKTPHKSLDLTLFLNGLPIFTAELKNPLSGQTVEAAIKQYRTTRNPHEPLFKFGVCLSHFAVDPTLVYMTTELKGTDTYFLPFNQGYDGGAGNPVKNSDESGYPSEYLWQNIWEKDSILDLIQNFITLVEAEGEKGNKTGSKKLIFPRYHQLDTVRSLLADAQIHGTGKRYLIQHSAGSGKSNSIAWLAHGFSNLHDANNNRVFDSVIVISDRRVIDRQLQNNLRQFQQTTGVVENIDRTGKQLKDALESGKTIIVTTLQKFSVIVDQIQALSGQKFAVIIDEAHSSQSGESRQKLSKVLSATTLEAAEKEDNSPENDTEDTITEAAKKRGFIKNLSYFAFTATPKKQTLELFGSQQPDGSFAPFSLYSMRQAIEERFILDVLANYTTYKSYFKILKTIETDPRYDRQKAAALLRNFVELHEHTIKQKIEIIVQHFQDHIATTLDGKAKAMIVTRSRLHAVRYKLGLDEYLRAKKLPYQSLVAFTGKVNDGAEFTETSMNTASAGKKISESATAETFKQDNYRFLIVANKFQTGFDQPLLMAMYIDKNLGGLMAVQTISRLNRTYPGKESVFVLDFANEADDIQQAFQPYYDRIILTEATDPNILYDLQI